MILLPIWAWKIAIGLLLITCVAGAWFGRPITSAADIWRSVVLTVILIPIGAFLIVSGINRFRGKGHAI